MAEKSIRVRLVADMSGFADAMRAAAKKYVTIRV